MRRGAALSLVLLLGVGLATGCAAAAAVRAARAAEQRDDLDAVVLEYSKAVRLKPDDVTLRRQFEAAKLRAAKQHFDRGRRLAAVGKYEEALYEYNAASELNPTSGDIADRLRETRVRLRTKLAVRKEGKTELQSLIELTRNLPPPGLDIPRGIALPDSLQFRSASSRDVFSALGQFANVNMSFDQTFREVPISIDLRSSTFDEALVAVAAQSHNFFRVTAQRTITIIPDTPSKRREYEEEVVRTFYLSDLDPKEAVDILRLVIDSRRLSAISSSYAVAVKDTPERIAAASKLIASIDKARAEVIIAVELLEVNRTRLKEYGLQIGTIGESGLSGSADVNRPDQTLRDLRNLTQADLFVTGVPGVVYRALKNDNSSRTLANPQLRTSDGIAAQAKFGEEVPIPVTTFSPIATGGVSQQPITSFNYRNIGVNLDITPRTHHNDDVSLTLRVEVTSVSGVGFGGLPTFGSRQISTTIRLRDGETNILAGLIRDEERRVVSGVPGLIDMPVIGRLFANNRTERTQTDIVLTLTPHIIRVLDITEADLRPFRIDKDSSGPLLELPQIEQPREPQPPAGETPLPGAQPILPVKPPDPPPVKPPPPTKPPAVIRPPAM